MLACFRVSLLVKQARLTSRSITTVCLKVLGRDMGYFSFKTSLRVVVDLE